MNKIIYKIFAELTIFIHFLWIIFILYGFILTFYYSFINKKSQEFFDRWLFRIIHLFGILYVTILEITNNYCPLTILENFFKSKYAPNEIYHNSFILNYLERFVYPDVNPYFLIIPTFFIALFTTIVFIIKPPKKIKDKIKNFNFYFKK